MLQLWHQSILNTLAEVYGGICKMEVAPSAASSHCVVQSSIKKMGSLQMMLYTICVPLILIVCVLAAILNILILVAKFHVKTRANSLELTFSLAASDTWTSIVIGASLFVNSYMPVILGIRQTSLCFSLTLEAFRSGGLLTGVLHLLALAICHFLSIAKPFNHEEILSRGKTQLIIILIWILPPFAFVGYFCSWPNQGYRTDRCADVSFYDNIYFRLVISCFIISLMLATGILYWRLLKRLNQVRIKTQSNSTVWKRRTVITSGLIFGTFLIGWLPASLLYVLTAVGMPLHNLQSIWLNIFALTSLVLIMVKTLTNPVIYATRIPEIRQFVSRSVKFGGLLRRENTGLEYPPKDEHSALNPAPRQV